ncbi:phosphoglucosamine mutase [Candidatus Saganbacteria bacterium]|nr:phosphoglucosamine mutase [Candidatus Saganbacteria bacterium]
MSLKISISGIRGFVPEALTPEICLDFAKAFGSSLQDGNPGERTVVIGTDPRASSEFIKGIVFSGLLATGCRVIDLGICPTPTVGIMVRELKADGGMVITASHNPLPWNGLKFMRHDGIFLNAPQAQKLIKIFETKKFVAGASTGVTVNNSANNFHVRKILQTLQLGVVRRRRFRVAIDCCNGAGSIIVPELLGKLNCQIFAINCDITKPFSHDPEPIAKNLKDLIRLVKATKADIGFALDSDADRLAIITNEAKPAGEELTLALAVKYLLENERRADPKHRLVVTNLSTTMLLDDIAKKNTARVVRTKIGEVHVAEKLKALGGLIGGEGNGGVIYPPVGFNRDAMAGITIILKLLARQKQTISQIIDALPHYFVIKEKIVCPDQHKIDIALAKVKGQFNKKNLILTEGIKVVLPQAWVHVRASNTEPIIRVIAEGRDKKEIKQLVERVLKILR